MQSEHHEISGANSSLVVDDMTGSLVISGSDLPETLTFYCTAENMFGSTQQSNITVEFYTIGNW